MRKTLFMAALVLFALGLFASMAFAHPGSGIIVDKSGNVYFVRTFVGVAKISADGKLTDFYHAADGHWMCLDEQGIFSRAEPKYFQRITDDGARPAIIFAGGGSPITLGGDGNFYYCGTQNGDFHPGAMTIVRESPEKQQSVLAPSLEDTLNELHDGITGLTSGPDGSLYIACWNSLLRVSMDGKVTTLVHPVRVTDCDEDPADHKEANRGLPLLRGIAVDSNGVIYTAATSCHCLLRISPQGEVRTILKSERPWSPTGVAVRNGIIYLLEYTHANGPKAEGWKPRVRKIDDKGKITTLADLSAKAVR